MYFSSIVRDLAQHLGDATRSVREFTMRIIQLPFQLGQLAQNLLQRWVNLVQCIAKHGGIDAISQRTGETIFLALILNKLLHDFTDHMPVAH